MQKNNSDIVNEMFESLTHHVYLYSFNDFYSSKKKKIKIT